jgi:4,4'-diaponeurosporenoate glycosyltransferase
MTLTIVLTLIGILLSPILYFRFPKLKYINKEIEKRKVSIIIPARNESINLPFLLNDLKTQTLTVKEIICVDDNSTDSTAEIAACFKTNVITLKDKPEGWIGKTWACYNGAAKAEGDLFIFIDADVRLSPCAIEKLINNYTAYGCVISVYPYNKVTGFIGQLSFFFTLILVAANGLSFIVREKNIGLFGAVILISREQYDSVGGFQCAKNNIIDDLTFGVELKKNGTKINLFFGGTDFYIKTYNNTLDFIQGWLKNIASGASHTSIILLIMVVLWVTSCASAPFYLIWYSININFDSLLYFYLILYTLWFAELLRLNKEIGNYSVLTIIFYPLYLIIFILIFMLSILIKTMRCNVKWKGRKIRL